MTAFVITATLSFISFVVFLEDKIYSKCMFIWRNNVMNSGVRLPVTRTYNITLKLSIFYSCTKTGTQFKTRGDLISGLLLHFKLLFREYLEEINYFSTI